MLRILSPRRVLTPLLLTALLATLALNARAADYTVKTLADGLNFPWSIAFLPDGEYLVAELGGQLLRLNDEGLVGPPIQGVPEVFRAGQGGLFDILLDPDFATNAKLYLSYAAGNNDANATTVASAVIEGNQLTNVQVIFEANPKKYAPLHYGGRMVWLNEDTLLLTTGDGFDFREEAQNQTTHFGKTIAINKATGEATVYTSGHRNPQGLAISKSGVIYLNEHGPKGGDEVNIITQGKNYGWPAITYGMDYNGAYVSPFTEHPSMEQPIHVWTPSIAPSGFMIYEGDMFPEWQNDLFVGALVDAEVRRLDLKGSEIVAEDAVFPEISARIRDVREGLNGEIFVLTDGPTGQVLAITR